MWKEQRRANQYAVTDAPREPVEPGDVETMLIWRYSDGLVGRFDSKLLLCSHDGATQP